MRKRIDFSRENRPFCYYQRVAILHAVESILFKIDSGYSFLLRAINEKHNDFSAYCPASESFAVGAVNVPNNRITLAGSWPVGKAVVVTSTNTVPGPLVSGTTYYIESIPLAGTVRLSASYGGPAIVLANQGVGTHTMRAALCPDIGIRIVKVSSGEDDHYSPVSPSFFASPSSLGAGVRAELAPYNTSAFGVNFTATPRKLARPIDSFFISGEVIQLLITGQQINSSTLAQDNRPSFVDIVLVGRHYPDNALPLWAKQGGR